uniref:Solute carrier family 3 member 2a n=1 Tax=Acanthochromis polyacanthus TaxID=80966 RepID=A0A3Q1GW80_9TELE
MSKDTEIDMKEVELNEMDPEKQPMTGDGQAAGGEKNGSVKLKVPEDEVTFTGLSKEELMKVAGTPGWVRTRWVLLVLFWLGWVGMLAGAIVIIVQAPRCKPIPDMSWWNEGPMYQISDVKAFSSDLKGVEAKLDDMNQLKVKALVLGPIHTVQPNRSATLELQQIDSPLGTQDDLKAVLDKAHKKGIYVVLDLTPDAKGSDPWFTDNIDDMMEKVKAAAEYWLNFGVDGIKLSQLTVATESADWSKLQLAVQGNRTDDTKKRALMGVVEGIPAPERIKDMDDLHSDQRSVGWGLGAAQKDQLSKLATSWGLIRLYQLLLFTMPGTPVFTYGDEIGLEATAVSYKNMIWDIEKEPSKEASENEDAKTLRTERVDVRKWFKSLSDLRGKERSLLHGDYYSLYSSDSSLSFLRVWDQSERYITAVNWGSQPKQLTLKLTPTDGVQLPKSAKVKMSTDSDLAADSSINLDNLKLGAGHAVLLQFPYTA